MPPAPRVLVGDCLALMPMMAPDSIDAIVSDPPYGLGFMGKAWDHGVPGAEFWREALRVAKPGAHLVAFGGTRTYHRLACAIEDAGWEIRDCLMWLYGTGFPKSLDVAKAIDKQRHDRPEVLEVTAWVRATRDANGVTNGAIDAAFGFNGMAGHWTTAGSQPAVPTLDQWSRLLATLGVEPSDVPERVRHLAETLNGLKGQPGAAWYDRVVVGHRRDGFAPGGNAVFGAFSGDTRITAPATDAARQWDGWGTALKPAWEPIILARKPLGGTVAATVLQYGTGALNIDGCRVGTSGGTRDTATGDGRKAPSFSRHNYGATVTEPLGAGRWPANLVLDEAAAQALDEATGERPTSSGAIKRTASIGYHGSGPSLDGFGYGDTGGASRFFYTAKASRREREAGLEGQVERRPVSDRPPDPIRASAGAHAQGAALNHHPTVKPLALMRWLVRLVTPPGGLVLDPFMGSGSTGCAAVLEGMAFVGCDLSPEYAAIAEARIAHWAAVADERPGELDLDAA